MDQTRQKKILHYSLLFFVAIVWGSGFIGTQIAIDEGLSSSFIMFNRFAVATLIVCVTCFKSIKTITKTELKAGVTVGVFLFLGFYTQTVGMRYTTPSNNAFLTATNVIMVPFLYWVLSRKKPSPKVVLCAFLCLIGIGSLSLNLKEGFSMSLGDSFTLLCAFFFACHITATGHYADKVDTKKMMFLQMATAMILSFMVFITKGENFAGYAMVKGSMAVLYLGVMSTCVAFFIQIAVQRYLPPTKTAIILSTESLFGSIFSVMLGFEAFTLRLLIGGGVIFLSILLAESNITFKKKKQNSVLN